MGVFLVLLSAISLFSGATSDLFFQPKTSLNTVLPVGNGGIFLYVSPFGDSSVSRSYATISANPSCEKAQYGSIPKVIIPSSIKQFRLEENPNVHLPHTVTPWKPFSAYNNYGNSFRISSFWKKICDYFFDLYEQLKTYLTSFKVGFMHDEPVYSPFYVAREQLCSKYSDWRSRFYYYYTATFQRSSKLLNPALGSLFFKRNEKSSLLRDLKLLKGENSNFSSEIQALTWWSSPSTMLIPKGAAAVKFVDTLQGYSNIISRPLFAFFKMAKIEMMELAALSGVSFYRFYDSYKYFIARYWRQFQIPTVSAWEIRGHEAIGMTAMSGLNTAALAKIKRMFKGQDLVDISKWSHKFFDSFPEMQEITYQQYKTSSLEAPGKKHPMLRLLNMVEDGEVPPLASTSSESFLKPKDAGHKLLSSDDSGVLYDAAKRGLNEFDSSLGPDTIEHGNYALDLQDNEANKAAGNNDELHLMQQHGGIPYTGEPDDANAELANLDDHSSVNKSGAEGRAMLVEKNQSQEEISDEGYYKRHISDRRNVGNPHHDDVGADRLPPSKSKPYGDGTTYSSWRGGNRNNCDVLNIDEMCGNSEMCLLPAIKYLYGFLTQQKDVMEANSKALTYLNKKLPAGNTLMEVDALKLFVHLLGDMHQPLHYSTESDKYGNDIKVQYLGRTGSLGPNSLFSFWDSLFIDRYARLQPSFWFGGWTNVASAHEVSLPKLAKEIIQKKEKIFNEWALESARFACSSVYGPVKNLLDPVSKRAGMVFDSPDGSRIVVLNDSLESLWVRELKRRILLSGARIAAIMNVIFSSKSVVFRQDSGISFSLKDSKKDPVTLAGMMPKWLRAFLMNFAIVITLLGIMWYITQFYAFPPVGQLPQKNGYENLKDKEMEAKTS